MAFSRTFDHDHKMTKGTLRWSRPPAGLALVAGTLLCLAPAPAFAQVAQPGTLSSQAAAPPRADGRRTMGRLLANLGRDVVGVFATDSLRPLLIGSAATGVAAIFDHEISDAIGDPESDFGEIGNAAGGGLVVGGVVAVLFVAGRLSDHQRFRAATYDVLTGTLVTQAYTSLIKVAVNRPRPYGSTSRIDSSFPSGHSSTSFAMATVLERHYGWKAGVPGYAVASIVAASRVRSDHHYISDVVAGSTLGIIVGRAAVRMNGKPLPASGGARRTSVSISPVGRAGLQVAIVF
jgi:membrane-associated phospholipid phosphatase